MNEKETKTTKELSTKEKTIRVVAIWVGLAIIGYIIGYILVTFKVSDITKIFTEISANTKFIFWTAIFLITGAVFASYSAAQYSQGKKLYASAGDDEDKLDKAENHINYAIVFSNILMISSFSLFGISVKYLIDAEFTKVQGIILTISTAGIFMGFIAAAFMLQRSMVELVKKYNPEKKGDLLDFDFHKKWTDSLDEGEMLSVYKASYKTMKAVNSACLIMWVITLIGMLVFNTGILAFVSVSVLWAVSVITYSSESAELEKK